MAGSDAVRPTYERPTYEHGRARVAGIPDPESDSAAALARGLAGYLRAVAEVIGVPPEGTTFEISDTATAYVGLARRWSQRPSQDVMLLWSEHDGWIVSVETDPGDPPVVVARLGGADPVPGPDVVARFVTDALAGPGETPTTRPSVPSRRRLAERLKGYATIP
jgi:hypothetical protein